MSDDGSELIYIAQAAGGRGAEVYRVAVATGAATRVRSLPEDVLSLTNALPRQVSPDGRNIVFGASSLERRARVLEIDLSGVLGSAPGARP